MLAIQVSTRVTGLTRFSMSLSTVQQKPRPRERTRDNQGGNHARRVGGTDKEERTKDNQVCGCVVCVVSASLLSKIMECGTKCPGGEFDGGDTHSC